MVRRTLIAPARHTYTRRWGEGLRSALAEHPDARPPQSGIVTGQSLRPPRWTRGTGQSERELLSDRVASCPHPASQRFVDNRADESVSIGRGPQAQFLLVSIRWHLPGHANPSLQIVSVARSPYRSTDPSPTCLRRPPRGQLTEYPHDCSLFGGSPARPTGSNRRTAACDISRIEPAIRDAVSASYFSSDLRHFTIGLKTR